MQTLMFIEAQRKYNFNIVCIFQNTQKGPNCSCNCLMILANWAQIKHV